MKEVWTVWIANDELETMLAGIATTEEKAYEMKVKIIEKFGDAFEVIVCEKKIDILDIYDIKIQF